MALVVFTVCTGAVFWYIHRFAENILYFDQWSDIDLLRHLHNGTLTFGTLWGQHVENRIFFPRLVVIVLGATTRFNVVVEDYLSGGLWCGFVWLMVVAHRRRSPAIPWLFYCPVAPVLLSFIPAADTLFGFNLTWFLAVFCLGAALFLLDRGDYSRAALVLALVAAVVGSFSSIQGLFIWPAGLVLLLLRRRPRRVVLAWVVSAAVTGVVYFAGFDFGQVDGNEGLLHHPLFRLEYFLSVIGNVFGLSVGPAPTAVNQIAVALGVVILVVAAAAVVRGCRSTQASGGAPLGVALIAFGLICALFVTVGRVQLGLRSAGRYDIFAMTIWVGSYLALVVPPRVGSAVGSARPDRGHWSVPTVVSRAALVVLVVLMVVQVAVGEPNGFRSGRGWKAAEGVMANVAVNMNVASDNVVQGELGNYSVGQFRQLAAFAYSQRLSIFGTPLGNADRRSGLLPGLEISVILPSAADMVSGTQPLDALVGLTTQHDHATVRFEVNRPGLPSVTVATAQPTIEGWVGRWDTTTMVDGTYLVRAVLLRPGQPSVISAPVAVRVDNPG